MKKNQIYEKDIPEICAMSLEQAVNTLHGHSVHLHKLGMSVAFDNHLVGAVCATVTDHYVDSQPIRYILQLDKNKKGKQIFDSTYAVLNTYLAFSMANHKT